MDGKEKSSEFVQKEENEDYSQEEKQQGELVTDDSIEREEKKVDQHGRRIDALTLDAASTTTMPTDASPRSEQNENNLPERQIKTRDTSSKYSTAPGAVSVVPNEQSQSVQQSGGSSDSTQQERDAPAKKSCAGVSIRLDSPLPRPGAVAMVSSNVSTCEDEPSSTNQEEHARLKSRASRRTEHTLGDGSSLPSTSAKTKDITATPDDSIHCHGLDELARRREERASARAVRRVARSEMKELNQNESSPAAVSATTEPTKYPDEKMGVNEDSVRDSSITSVPLFANMSEEQRQSAYDRKMAQMELEHQERLNRQGNTARYIDQPTSTPSFSVLTLECATNANATTPGSLNTMVEEQQRSIDTNFATLNQGHVNHPGKRAQGVLSQDRNVVRTCEQIDQEPPQPEVHKDISQDVGSKFEGSDSSRLFASSTEQLLNPSDGDLSYSTRRGISTVPGVEEGTYQEIPDNQLAVAIEIDEDEFDVEMEKLVLVHATEYDPNSKPPLYKNRRFRLYGLGGCCVFLVLLIVLVSISISNFNKSGGSGSGEISYYQTNAPTVSATYTVTTARENEYRSYFAEEVSPLVFEPGNPLFLASEWILNEDPQQLDIDNPQLLQRFILAFWYFHTSEMGSIPWVSCNPPSPGQNDTCTFKEFGRDQEDNIIYTEVPNSVRWLSSQDECDWQGVICGSGSVVAGLRIIGQNLTGTLPTEIGALPFLQVLQLYYNLFTGTLPPSYANFQYLISLEVHGNRLTGEIPSEFFEQDSRSLLVLNVGDNWLSGTLDTRVAQLTNLKGLHLFGNSFYGTIPQEIGDLKYLAYTRMNGNNFTGQIPTSFGGLPQLTEFWCNDNQLTGTLPAEFGALRRMTYFQVINNQIGGSIPPALFNMTRAQFILLDQNKLTGALPSTELLQLSDLMALRVSRNMLTGTIPTELGGMPSLRLVWLHLNLFTGSLPDTVCNANVPDGLNYIQVDCAPSESPPNPCRCCSSCCDRTTEVCLLMDNA